MNIEKLYTISNIILNDFSQKEISSNLEAMITNLQNSVNQPQQPNHQQGLSKAKTDLYRDLDEAASNKFNVIDIAVTKELGIDEFLGLSLRQKIEDVFLTNEITPSTALVELTEINNTVVKNIAALTKLTQGFNDLNFEDIITKESFNLVVRVPREVIDNNLSGFAASMGALNTNLLVFSEISTGTRESFKIDSLSTSDPTLVLTLSWATGLLMLDILAKIAAIYGAVTLLKKQRQEFIDNGAPEDKLNDLTDWIANQIKEKIAEEIPPLVDKHCNNIDNNRKNELKIEARRKALRIAENIDNGYTFDIETPETPDEDDPEVIADIEKLIEQLNIDSRQIEQTKIIGSNLLGLPEDDEDLN
jgi:hypothetical protein